MDNAMNALMASNRVLPKKKELKGLGNIIGNISKTNSNNNSEKSIKEITETQSEAQKSLFNNNSKLLHL